ncbi:hypothetical protein FE789_14020 [Burkholderia pseudomallei]|nr:hypothetical protein FE789_14020 [Burkholderia pseudomallei]
MGGRAAQSRRTASRVRVAGVEAMRSACSARFAVRIGRVSAGRDPLRSAAIRCDPLRSAAIRCDPLRSAAIRCDPLRSASIRFDRIARALSRTDRGGGGRGMRGRHTGAGTACERWRHTVTGRRIGGNRMASSVAAVIARPRAGLTIVRVR